MRIHKPGCLMVVLAAIILSGRPGLDAQESPIAPRTPLAPTDLTEVHLNRPTLDRLYLTNQKFFPSLLGLTRAGAQSFRTKHFDIFYLGAPNTARQIAEIADDKLEQLARFYPEFMDKYQRITVLVRDDSDVLGNAFASDPFNFMMFWATPFDITERGSSRWVENVFVHELAHLITHRAASKEWPFRIALLSTSQSNKNPDYVFGIPFYNKVMPSWFSEGIAQLEADLQGDDTWDTHRDMLLRMAVLEDDLLSLDQMNVFYKDGHHHEMVYNQGFGFLHYIKDTYGEDRVRAINGKKPVVSFDSAIKQATGVSARNVYLEWKKHLEEKYRKVAARVRSEEEHEGEIYYDDGSMDFHPTLSPDGRLLAFLSNENADFALTHLKVIDLTTGKVRKIADDRRFGRYVWSRISWSPDSEVVYFSKGGTRNLYRYDLTTGKERRITAGLRGRDPAASPDGATLAFVGTKDGSNRLGLVNSDGTDVRYILAYNDGTQIFGPKWSPDGRRILFTIFHGEDRDIAAINADATPMPDKIERFRLDKAKEAWEEEQATKKKEKEEEEESDADEEEWVEAFPDTMAYAEDASFVSLISTVADERDAIWAPDGNGIIYSSDRTGIFNLYARNLEDGSDRQLTNVVGGAFVPTVTPDGNEVVYAGFHAADYSIYRLPDAVGTPITTEADVEREYRQLHTGPELDDLFDSRARSTHVYSLGFIPFLQVGPTFIGNRFGLDEIRGGAQASFGQLLGGDALTFWGTLGKNFRRNVDLNTQFAAFYQKALTTVYNENGAIAPRVIIGGSRQTINSLVELGTIDVVRDTMNGTLQATIDSQTVLIPDATQFLDLTLDETDTFRDVFTDFIVGTSFRLGRRQNVSLFYGQRNYNESLRALQTLRDSTRITARDGAGNIVDITADIIPVDTSVVFLDDFIYENLRFFKSHDMTFAWNYTGFERTFDRFLNPRKGRSVSFIYRRTNATVTDSLSRSFDLDNMTGPDPTVVEVSPTLFREDNVGLRLNEFIASWNEFIPLPGRTTWSIQGFVGYKDRVIKESRAGGGAYEGAFYYPLRYYLGGLGTLRGYPYFTLSGGKVVFARTNFTFPIFNRSNKELAPFTFNKLYGSIFFETGATGNAPSFSAINFSRKPFLSDWGFELRMEVLANYTLPMFGFFQIAFPTKKMVPDRRDPTMLNEVDDFRIYFGLSI